MKFGENIICRKIRFYEFSHQHFVMGSKFVFSVQKKKNPHLKLHYQLLFNQQWLSFCSRQNIFLSFTTEKNKSHSHSVWSSVILSSTHSVFFIILISFNYRQKLTSPKWNSFKGIRLRWKDKIRLNNLIWRCWHMQCKLNSRGLSFYLVNNFVLLPLIKRIFIYHLHHTFLSFALQS